MPCKSSEGQSGTVVAGGGAMEVSFDQTSFPCHSCQSLYTDGSSNSDGVVVLPAFARTNASG